MSKKTFMATIIILALLISLTAGLQTVDMAKAELVPPTEPITEPPSITVQSPNSTTYFTNQVPLNFTVNHIELIIPIYYHLTKVSYDLDGQEVMTFPFIENNTQQFSTVIQGLSNGNHIVKINVFAESEYGTNPVWNGNNYQYTLHFYDMQTSQTVSFTVNIYPSPSPSTTPTQTPTPTFTPTPVSTPTPSPTTQPTPSPSPSHTAQPKTGFLGTSLPMEYAYALAAFLIVTVVGLTLLVYFKKLRK